MEPVSQGVFVAGRSLFTALLHTHGDGLHEVAYVADVVVYAISATTETLAALESMIEQ